MDSFYTLNNKLMADLMQQAIPDFSLTFKLICEGLEDTIGNLDYPQKLFSSNDKIWPDQRQYAICYIDQTMETLNQINYITNNKSKFPPLLASKRYQLIIMIGKGLELGRSLKHQINIAEHHGGTSYSEREKILIELKKLIENLSDVSQEMRSLIHQAKFLTARP